MSTRFLFLSIQHHQQNKYSILTFNHVISGCMMSNDPVPHSITCPATSLADGDLNWSGRPLVQALTRKFIDVSKVIFCSEEGLLEMA